MKLLKFVLYGLLFLITGEFVSRIDERFDLLNNSPQKIKIEMQGSKLIDQLEKGEFKPDSNEIRILVLGDSYIYGGGISPKDKFSNQLINILADSLEIDKTIHVLDVSRPDNSTLDNYQSFKYYQADFKPHYVFWAYNINDLLFNIPREKPLNKSGETASSTAPKQETFERGGLKKKILFIYSNSLLISHLSTTIQKELKFRGYVLPVGDFYNLTTRAYTDSNDVWVYSKDLLSEVSAISKSNNSEFVLYRLPDFNLIEHPELFSAFDKAMHDFGSSNDGITYINGLSDFEDIDGEKCMLSKYDGHPNAYAHYVMARKFAELIRQGTARPIDSE